MKRTVAALMTILMLCCVSAYAETAAVAIPEITFDETTAAYAGQWLNFEDDGFMVYMPTDWVDVEITDEMLAAGTYYAATSADGTLVMTVTYTADAQILTIEELEAQLTTGGCENVMQVTINGISVVGYDLTAQDVSGMAFVDGVGGMYVFSFTPVSNEAYAPIAQTMISSLSLIPEATTAQ